MPPTLGDVLMERDQLTIDSQDEHDGMLGDRHGVGPAILADRHACLAGPLDVDAVIPGTQDLD